MFTASTEHNSITINTITYTCFTRQTSPEISFLDSLEDSIFYSIARCFLSKSNTVLPPECSGKNLQGSKQVANNLDLCRSICNIAVDPPYGTQ